MMLQSLYQDNNKGDDVKLEKMTSSRFKPKQLNNEETAIIHTKDETVQISLKNHISDDKYEVFILSLSREEIIKLLEATTKN